MSSITAAPASTRVASPKGLRPRDIVDPYPHIKEIKVKPAGPSVAGYLKDFATGFNFPVAIGG